MSEEKKPDAAAAPEDTGPKPSKLPLIMGLLNTVALLAALGTFTYTRLLFKRPPITEEGERQLLLAAKKKKAPSEIIPGYIKIDKITANIAPQPPNPKPAEGTESQIQGKLHYLTMEFHFEVNHQPKAEQKLDIVRSKLMDMILNNIGKKSFDQLATIHGRFILRSEIQDMANNLFEEPLVTNVFFSEFIVQ